MRAMKLDISRLPTAENKLIQAYFRLYAHEPDFFWEIAEVPPFDAIMVDGENPDIDIPATDGGLRIVLDGDVASECSLPRPLRSDTLVALLRSLQSPAAPTLMPELNAKAAEPQSTEDTEADGIADAREHFQLSSLPPVALLQRNPQRQLAASLLLRRPMTLQEVSQATRWQLNEAQTFISLLRNTGLLEISEQLPKAPENAPEPALTADPDSKLSFGSALSSFRKKLGL